MMNKMRTIQQNEHQFDYNNNDIRNDPYLMMIDGYE